MASSTSGFSDAERSAMQARTKELKAEARRGSKRAKGGQALQEAISEMPEADRAMAEQLHEIVSRAAPHLMPKTWYGMPAYANADDKVVCFFQAASKFGARYSTFGFNDAATLDDGAMWPTTFALTKVTRAVAKQVEELVVRAAETA